MLTAKETAGVPHYLDHAASSPLAPGVLDAWVEAQHALSSVPGNPAALHAGGRSARRMLEDARERIAHALGAERAEVVLTSGATESDALAVVGGARGVHARAAERTRVYVSAVEHDAVGEQGGALAAQGLRLELLPLSSGGVTTWTRDFLWEAVPRAALFSLTWVCSELGTLQPVETLVRDVHEAVDAQRDMRSSAEGGDSTPNETPGETPEHLGQNAQGTVRSTTGPSRPLIHTDAAQAVGYLPVNFRNLGVDLLSVGGHKVGAPVGTGALLVRRGTPLLTDRPGGGHERGIRSGTPDVAGAVALAVALEVANERRAERVTRAEVLRERLYAQLPPEVRPTVKAQEASSAIIHLSVPTRHPEALLLSMDMAGVHVSAGSACHAGVTRPSTLVMRMGRSEDEALGVLRISTGYDTTAEDIDAFARALPAAIRAGQALDARDEYGKGQS